VAGHVCGAGHDDRSAGSRPGHRPQTEETTMIRILATTALALGLVAGVAQAQTTSTMGTTR
ncbi:unnamed protein product, partial [Acidocella sp. C78]